MKQLIFLIKERVMIKQNFCAKYSGCKIPVPSQYKVKNVNSPVVFCVDCVYRNTKNATGRRCDEFIFFDISREVTGIYLIERKTNSTNATRVQEQLQGGANYVTSLVTEDPALDEYRHKFDFMPVFVSSPKIAPSQRRRILALKISLIGKTKNIRYVRKKGVLPKFST